ncbi:putative bifunctional diguanylate cyclase/phosphodiesterase [Aquisalimonas asiatica]|uniref:Diguanylate cyclase (GGDEF) domain-containing protein n=1 Tax=Aquisalimonas asiatica TaxID=406100 RepID=A0A1H8V115_9GAMM|nr:GGDEF domain-containing protein [Aquisalimonas asiatica]SEP08894.1 diguanylate cyclase (GGDEF) domain-containing protein [Aquisalimonas asiatica]
MEQDLNLGGSVRSATEDERLYDLYSLNVLDTSAETRFDRLTHLIADIFRFPVVLISLVDRDREWFKSAFGWERKEVDRDISFCAHAIDSADGVFLVPDTLRDPRFVRNPLVTGEPGIRFYAGVVVHGPAGHPVGTLCVIDRIPRAFDEQALARLRQFAELVQHELHHVRELRRLRAAIEFSVFYDPLTRLPNRRLLGERLQHLIELSQRDGRKVVVLLFNIEGLRLINESHGTAAGDRILVELATRLRDGCPPGGTAARLEGNECALVLPAPGRDTGCIDTIAEQVRTALERPFIVDGHEHYLHIRIGGSVFPDHGTTPRRLLERAAAAVRVPSDGLHRPVRFVSQADSADISRRIAVESRLRRATERQEFRLYYQPITSLSDNGIVSYEALLRWHDEELGEMSPASFIAVAEQTGLIVPMGRWVVEESCRQLAAWRRAGVDVRPVSVNVEAVQLQDPRFAAMVLDSLTAAGIPPELMHLEVTELSLVSHGDHVAENMRTLSDARISIYVDDFGTGYASLDYLRRMPIAGLKIDRSFVDGLPDDSQDVTLTRSMIGMARSLGLQTVAEGVETWSQYQFLRESGCALVQGYLLARPMPADAVSRLPATLHVSPGMDGLR